MGQARALCYNLSFVYDDLRIYTTSSSALLCSSRRMDYKSSHSLAFVTSQTHFANPLSSIPPNESFFFFFFFFLHVPSQLSYWSGFSNSGASHF